MPFVGGFVALRSGHGQQLDAIKTVIHGDFFKIKFPPPFDTIKGKVIVNFNAYRISHGGIKIRLQGNLQINNHTLAGTATGKPLDIFRLFPIENSLTCKSP